MFNPNTYCAVLVAGLLFLATPASAADDVYGGSMFTLTGSSTAPNGGWNWCSDERVIIDDTDPNNTLMLLSTVSAGTGSEAGDIDLHWRNLDTGLQGEFELHDQLQQDDHNMAALYMRPDGRYVAAYSQHTSDIYTRYRLSTNPHDPTAWDAEFTVSNANNATYNNIYYLDNDNGGSGRLYNFTRADNWDPTVHVSYDQGSTWTRAGKLLTQGGGSDRPYLEYASHGERIHFISTEEHPRQVQNSIYHGYVEDGVLYNSYGEVMDSNIFDFDGVSPTKLTTVFRNGEEFNGTTMNRAWTISLELDNTHNPVGIISVRANDDPYNHRYLYARFDGADWQVNEMCQGGSYMYDYENDYLGLMSIDPQNPNVVYMANDIDPRDGTATEHHELYKGVTADFGQTWAWEAVTANSTVDNLRPAIPEWDGSNTAIAWLRGTYNTWSEWSDLTVVGMTLQASDAKALLWRGDAAVPGAWDVGGQSNWDSGGGLSEPFLNGAEVAFDDTAASYAVNIASPVAPSNTAFNNRTQAYTVTGAGIGGGGRLRVLGGGQVTLGNGANTYTGDTMIARGTLALSGTASLDNTPEIAVHANGTFDVSAAAGGAYTLDGQTLTVDGQVTGSVVAANGSTVYVNASNAIVGDVTVQSGSLVEGSGGIAGNVSALGGTVRVGGEGLDLRLSQFVVDDFEGYATGLVRDVASPPWTAHGDTMFAAIEDDGSSVNNALTYGWSTDYRGASLEVPYAGQIDNTEVATLFFRFNSKTDDPDHAIGLSDGADTSGAVWSDFETQFRVIDDPDAAGTFMVDARDGGAFSAPLATGLATDTWYNVWMVVDQTTDTYDLYLSTGTADATAGSLIGSGLAFRNGTSETLNTILGLSGPAPIDYAVRVDDLVYLDGIDLTNPLGGLDPVVLGGGEILSVGGGFAMSAGTVLELDISAPTAVDRLDVAGDFTAAGTLRVSLTTDAPAPQLGDVFDILEFAAADGAFDALDLPGLSQGLYWDTSRLLLSGELEVVAWVDNADFDGDGDVDAADLMTWQRGFGSGTVPAEGDANNDGVVDAADLAIWKSQFGADGEKSTPLVAVPEPAGFLLSIAATAVLLMLPGRIKQRVENPSP